MAVGWLAARPIVTQAADGSLDLLKQSGLSSRTCADGWAFRGYASTLLLAFMLQPALGLYAVRHDPWTPLLGWCVLVLWLVSAAYGSIL